MTDGTPTRFGYVAFLGEPNAGKSTLMNALIGAKVAIVTHKVQTTRARIRGIAIEGASQIVYVDTPGVFSASRRLDRSMVAAAWGGAADAETVAVLVEANRGITEGVRQIFSQLEELVPADKRVLIINKIDKVQSEQLLGLAEEANKLLDFSATFMISAERGHGVDKLRAHFAAAIPEGPWHYPEDQVADMPLRMIASEITREKLMLRLHEELPYQLTVETETWQNKKDGSARLDQVIYVTREGHKGIVLGKGGTTIKSISQAARKELADFLGHNVHLFLEVKLRPNWLEERERYREMGLDFDI